MSNPDTSKSTDGPDLGAISRQLGPAVAIPAIMAAVLPALGGFTFIAFATSLKGWMDSHGDAAKWGFVGVFALTTGLALMPTYALSFGAGVFFGWQLGGPLAVAGAALGSVVGYLVWGLVARERVLKTIETNPKAKVVKEALVNRSAGRTLALVTLLRIPPNSPFALTNMVMSSVKVNPVIYFVGTVAGMTPRTVLAAFIGATVGSIEKVGEAGGQWKLIGMIAGVGVILLVVWLASRWARQALKQELGE
jgi:uncharacterized membrane protein YdjX (TVP38/TMEM64 family)